MTGIAEAAQLLTAEIVVGRMQNFLNSESNAKYWILSIVETLLSLRGYSDYYSQAPSIAINSATEAVTACDGDDGDFYEAGRAVDLCMLFGELNDDQAEHIRLALREIRDKMGLENESLESYLRRTLEVQTGTRGDFHPRPSHTDSISSEGMYIASSISQFPVFMVRRGVLKTIEIGNCICQYYSERGAVAECKNDAPWGYSVDVKFGDGNKNTILITDAQFGGSKSNTVTIKMKGF